MTLHQKLVNRAYANKRLTKREYSNLLKVIDKGDLGSEQEFKMIVNKINR